ncbi:MAG: hypothetical protein Q8Q54_14815 [Methylococcales bacterium]|nr:hypothetical protein [Methylococcales bacterium]MDP3840188.1 hypothetical protein [Methylococcales bacterium]
MGTFSLLGRLFGAQVDQAGESLVGALVAFDPETATEVDRDALADKIQGVARKFAEAKQDYDKEQNDVVVKEAQIAQYLTTLDIMVGQLERQEISQAAFDDFFAGIEEAQAQLVQEQEEAAEAKAVKDELDDILKILTSQLNDFDKITTKALRDVKLAESQVEKEKLKADRQAELANLKNGIGAESTAVRKLQQIAQKAKIEAEAAKTVREITAKPQSQAEKMEAMMAQAKQAGAPAVSTLSAAERVAALKAKTKA